MKVIPGLGATKGVGLSNSHSKGIAMLKAQSSNKAHTAKSSSEF